MTLLLFGHYAQAVAPNFPDPMMIKASDGLYYAYATGTEGKNHLVVSFSADMKTWSPPQEILPEKPVWALKKKKFWAPHVIQRGSLFYLFYSAEPDFSAFENMRIGVAISSSPRGPFRDIGTYLDTGDAEENIDPMVFQDPASKKTFLYWGRNGEIAVQELDPSLLKFKAGTKPASLLRPSREDYQKVVEGPYVIERNGHYYLFYSGDDCCSDPHYAVLSARARSPLGPFQKLSSIKNSDGVILRGNSRWQNPGHNGIYRDSSGKDWIIYHVIDAHHPRHEDGNIYRVLKISPLEYRQGWPQASLPN